MEHPWEVSLEELVAMVRRERGDYYADLILFHGELRDDVSMTEILEPDTSRSLLVAVGLNPIDFAHDPS